MWWWIIMQKISWTDRLRNEEAEQRLVEEENIVHTIKGRKVTGSVIGGVGIDLYTRCWRQDRRKEVPGRRGRRCKQLLDDLNEKRGYLKLKEEELDRTVWRTRFGRGNIPVVKQTAAWMNACTRERNQARSTRISRATFSPRHSVVLPAKIFEMRKRILTISLEKSRVNGGVIVKNHEILSTEKWIT